MCGRSLRQHHVEPTVPECRGRSPMGESNRAQQLWVQLLPRSGHASRRSAPARSLHCCFQISFCLFLAEQHRGTLLGLGTETTSRSCISGHELLGLQTKVKRFTSSCSTAWHTTGRLRTRGRNFTLCGRSPRARCDGSPCICGSSSSSTRRATPPSPQPSSP